MNLATIEQEKEIARRRQAVLDERAAAFLAARENGRQEKQTRIAVLDERLAAIATEQKNFDDLARTRQNELKAVCATTRNVTYATDPQELAAMLGRETALEMIIGKIENELARLKQSAQVARDEKTQLLRMMKNGAPRL